MNKHAYLIIAHNEPEILSRLLCLLDDERNHFYIHIDKKSRAFDNIGDLCSKVKISKIFFMKRTKVAWGGDSLIKCELLLLEQAVNSGEEYSFYHFLSGVDMPIKPKDTIYKFFEERKNFIFLDYDSKTMEDKFIDRVKYYYFFQNKVGRERNKYSFIQQKLLNLQKRFHVDRSTNKCYQKGSNWCSLNGASANYVVKNKKQILRDFKWTLIGDELFIHTIIFNSPYLSDVYMYKEGNGYAARHVDWERGMPYIFREEDVEELMSCEAMFARKFSWTIDKNIILKIYNNLIE